jgi:hypothetical protein
MGASVDAQIFHLARQMSSRFAAPDIVPDEDSRANRRRDAQLSHHRRDLRQNCRTGSRSQPCCDRISHLQHRAQ